MKANAVFAGGGIKGIGLLGAFSVAEEQGYRWEKLAGTSVGGMLAALVASGYKAREIYEIIEGFDFTQLYDGDFQKLLPGLGMLTSIIFEKGIYQGRALENWMRSLLKAKGVS
ncbi:MAG TPA: patatin-like phospholipase family protein, partial [Bacillota bacterium]|nr:patatin-like phospholipase family protein [Bacillota bacterium]